MLGFLRRRRRAKVLAEPFPDEWRIRLELDVALWRAVPDEGRQRLEDDLRLFIAERYWEPCGGIALDEEMCAVIAAQACVLTLGRSVDAFDHVRSILVYPSGYRAPDVWEDEAGIVTEEIDEREGEAWERGIVVLAWQELANDARTLNGRNLVLHEMAHQVDLVDVLTSDPGGFEGGRPEAVRRLDAFLAAFEAFCDQVDSGKRVKGLDSYGTEDESEFFSVATESFFERGRFLQTHHPELYEVLAWYYGQDPASWPPPPKREPAAGTTGRDRRRRRREEERRLRKRRRRGE
jgi:Mlc titration factor MtfA (ptsG expression regulator)